MNGAEALAAFLRASALVKQGEYEEALQVPMLPSDLEVIKARIAASANRAETQR